MDQIVAAQVATSSGLEGILLMDCGAKVAFVDEVDVDLQPNLLSAIGLWALVLAERLEKLELSRNNQALTGAFGNLLTTMEQNERLHGIRKNTDDVITPDLLR